MNIDFNNVRRLACDSLNKLIATLNGGIESDTDEHPGMITIAARDIEPHINDLRMFIGSIAATYQKDDPEFISLDIAFVDFNPKPDSDGDS